MDLKIYYQKRNRSKDQRSIRYACRINRGEIDVRYQKKAIRIYEKALPNDFTWLEKMQAAKQAGFDYIEISVDESDERLARLDWSDEQIEEIRSYMKETGIIIPSMCLSGHRRFPFGSKNKEMRDKAFEIMEKESS